MTEVTKSSDEILTELFDSFKTEPSVEVSNGSDTPKSTKEEHSKSKKKHKKDKKHKSDEKDKHRKKKKCKKHKKKNELSNATDKYTRVKKKKKRKYSSDSESEVETKNLNKKPSIVENSNKENDLPLEKKSNEVIVSETNISVNSFDITCDTSSIPLPPPVGDIITTQNTAQEINELKKPKVSLVFEKPAENIEKPPKKLFLSGLDKPKMSIKIGNLKNSQVLEAAEEAKIKAEKYEEGEITDETSEESAKSPFKPITEPTSDNDSGDDEKKKHKHHHKKCRKRTKSVKETSDENSALKFEENKNSVSEGSKCLQKKEESQNDSGAQGNEIANKKSPENESLLTKTTILDDKNQTRYKKQQRHLRERKLDESSSEDESTNAIKSSSTKHVKESSKKSPDKDRKKSRKPKSSEDSSSSSSSTSPVAKTRKSREKTPLKDLKSSVKSRKNSVSRRNSTPETKSKQKKSSSKDRSSSRERVSRSSSRTKLKKSRSESRSKIKKSRSPSRSKGRRSRSRSRYLSRKSRSGSRSRRRKSSSRSRERKSRSLSYSKTRRRSRSHSKTRLRKSRTPSKYRGRKSRSISKHKKSRSPSIRRGKAKRSRSHSRSKTAKSRSPSRSKGRRSRSLSRSRGRDKRSDSLTKSRSRKSRSRSRLRSSRPNSRRSRSRSKNRSHTVQKSSKGESKKERNARSTSGKRSSSKLTDSDSNKTETESDTKYKGSKQKKSKEKKSHSKKHKLKKRKDINTRLMALSSTKVDSSSSSNDSSSESDSDDNDKIKKKLSKRKNSSKSKTRTSIKKSKTVKGNDNVKSKNDHEEIVDSSDSMKAKVDTPDDSENLKPKINLKQKIHYSLMEDDPIAMTEAEMKILTAKNKKLLSKAVTPLSVPTTNPAVNYVDKGVKDNVFIISKKLRLEVKNADLDIINTKTEGTVKTLDSLKNVKGDNISALKINEEKSKKTKSEDVGNNKFEDLLKLTKQEEVIAKAITDTTIETVDTVKKFKTDELTKITKVINTSTDEKSKIESSRLNEVVKKDDPIYKELSIKNKAPLKVDHRDSESENEISKTANSYDSDGQRSDTAMRKIFLRDRNYSVSSGSENGNSTMRDRLEISSKIETKYLEESKSESDNDKTFFGTSKDPVKHTDDVSYSKKESKFKEFAHSSDSDASSSAGKNITDSEEEISQSNKLDIFSKNDSDKMFLNNKKDFPLEKAKSPPYKVIKSASNTQVKNRSTVNRVGADAAIGDIKLPISDAKPKKRDIPFPLLTVDSALKSPLKILPVADSHKDIDGQHNEHLPDLLSKKNNSENILFESDEKSESEDDKLDFEEDKSSEYDSSKIKGKALTVPKATEKLTNSLEARAGIKVPSDSNIFNILEDENNVIPGSPSVCAKSPIMDVSDSSSSSDNVAKQNDKLTTNIDVINDSQEEKTNENAAKSCSLNEHNGQLSANSAAVVDIPVPSLGKIEKTKIPFPHSACDFQKEIVPDKYDRSNLIETLEKSQTYSKEIVDKIPGNVALNCFRLAALSESNDIEKSNDIRALVTELGKQETTSKTKSASRSRSRSKVNKSRSISKRSRSRRSKSKDRSISRRSKSKDKSISRRSKSKDKSASRRSKSKDRSISRRPKSKDRSISRRSKSKDRSISRRSKSKDKSASRRSKSKDRPISRKSKDRSISRRSASKDRSISRRSKSKDRSISRRSKSKHRSISRRSKSKDRSISRRSKSKEKTSRSRKDRSKSYGKRSRSKGRRSRSKEKRRQSRDHKSRSISGRSHSKEKSSRLRDRRSRDRRSRSRRRALSRSRRRTRSRERRSRSRRKNRSQSRNKRSRSKERKKRSRSRNRRSRSRCRRLRTRSRDKRSRSKRRRARSQSLKDKRSRSRTRKERSRTRSKDKISSNKNKTESEHSVSSRLMSHSRSKSPDKKSQTRSISRDKKSRSLSGSKSSKSLKNVNKEPETNVNSISIVKTPSPNIDETIKERDFSRSLSKDKGSSIENEVDDDKTSVSEKSVDRSSEEKSNSPPSAEIKRSESPTDPNKHHSRSKSPTDVKKRRSRSKSTSKSGNDRSSLTKHKSKSPDYKSKRSRSESLDKLKSKAKRIRSRSKSNGRSHSKDFKTKSKEKKSRSSESKSKIDEKHSKSQRKRSRSRSKSKEKTKSRDKRSRSHERRSKSRDKKSRRSRSRSRRRKGDKKDRSRRSRSRSKSRSHKRTKKSRSRSRSKDEFFIDKSKLLEIARKNALSMMKQGAVGTDLNKVTAITAGGKTVDELTDFCKLLSQKDATGQESVSSESSSENESEKPFHHPFQLKERSNNIIMNIRNCASLPVKTLLEKTTENAQQLRLQFPVSSGQLHRKSENEWIPVSPKKTDEPKAIMPAPTKKVEEDLPKQPDLQETVNFSNIPLPNALPQPQLQLSTMPQMSIPWQQPLDSGLFTGTTGARVLSHAELASGQQAWAKKDQLICAQPVSGGMGMSLLQKMGWKPGEGLGKRNEGTLEPLKLQVKTDKRGLVCADEIPQPRFRPHHHIPKNHPHHHQPLKSSEGKHPVSLLVEYCTRAHYNPPLFTVLSEDGPAHKKNFVFKVTVNGIDYQPPTPSPNKKQAKSEAAVLCLRALGLLPTILA